MLLLATAAHSHWPCLASEFLPVYLGSVSAPGDRTGLSSPSELSYCTAMVTVFEAIPLALTDTGTAVPEGALAGTCAFTWYSPTKPGARPA